jgi:hypothetical protein
MVLWMQQQPTPMARLPHTRKLSRHGPTRYDGIGRLFSHVNVPVSCHKKNLLSIDG